MKSDQTTKEEVKKERMGPYFAVFNSHINDAINRADKEFKAQFGEDKFNEWIRPRHEDGIMTVFHGPSRDSSNPKVEAFYQGAWIALCTFFVEGDS